MLQLHFSKMNIEPTIHHVSAKAQLPYITYPAMTKRKFQALQDETESEDIGKQAPSVRRPRIKPNPTAGARFQDQTL